MGYRPLGKTSISDGGSKSNRPMPYFGRVASRFLHVTACHQDVELDDRIYNHYLSFIQQPYVLSVSAPLYSLSMINRSAAPDFAIACPRAPPSDSYITHYWCLSGTGKKSLDGLIHLEDYRTVTLRESRTTIQDGTTGLRQSMIIYSNLL